MLNSINDGIKGKPQPPSTSSTYFTLPPGLLSVVMQSSQGDKRSKYSHLKEARNYRPHLPGSSSAEMLMRWVHACVGVVVLHTY